MSVEVEKKKRICHVSEHNMLEYSELLEIQFNSFYSLFRAGSNFKERHNERLYELFNSLLPVVSHDGRYVWEFVDYEIKYPRYTYEECLEYGITYSVPLMVKFRLIENILSNKKDKNSYRVKDESEVYFGEIPYITNKCSFVINGSERVIVNHIHKTNGVFFFKSKYGGTLCETCNIIPVKGFWIDIVYTNGMLYAYIDQKKISLMIFLRALGYCCGKNVLVLLDIVDEIKINPNDLGDLIGRKLAVPIIKSYDETFCEDNNNTTVLHRKMILLEKGTILDKENITKIVDNDIKSVLVYKINTSPSVEIFIKALNVDLVESDIDAVSRLYYLIKGSYAPTKQHALNTVSYMFFNEAKYNLGVMGRFKLNKLFNENRDDNYLTIDDFINLTNHILRIVEGTLKSDDIDHLNNKNLDCVGDQLYNNIYIGLSRSIRMISERMNVSQDVDIIISDLINTSAFTSVVNSFFATNQLSQFMDNVNPLAEVVHKRRVSALGSGGVSKDSLATNIRDIHYSQYGRLCAIETPEGASIGLISSLALHAKLHKLGLLMTPYYVVKNGIVDFDNNNIVFLLASEDDHKMIAQACTKCDTNGKIIDEFVKVRCSNDFLVVHRDKVEYMDISTNQPFSVSTALIPFVEHDDATRALMGSNMQRQAVPLLVSESPIVGTGMERKVAHEYKGLIFAEYDGVIKYVDARKIIVEYDFSEKETLISYEGNTREYSIPRMCGTNQNTCINYSPIVVLGQKVSKGEPLVRGFATDNGELALGRNLKVAFITWKGYNYEDAIVISEKLVKNDIFTSMYMEVYTAFTYVTKLGPEVFTKDIQSLSEKAVKNLDKNGLVMEGTVVHEGDVLVGKLTPKESSNLCPEEKLLRVLFGNKAYDFYDVSLYVPPFAHGVVVKSKLFERSIGGTTKETIAKLRDDYNDKLKKFFDVALDKFARLLDGYKSVGLKNINGNVIVEPGVEFTKEILNNNILVYSRHHYGLENILDKFTSLIGNYVSEGVYLGTGETVIEKGVKFNKQIIRDKILSYDCDEQGNYSLKVLPNLSRYNWTDNDEINVKIGILIRQTLKQNLFNGLYEFDVLQNIVTSDWTDEPETNQLLNRLIKNTLYQHNLILNEYNKKHLTLINGDQLPSGVLKMAKIQVANKRKLSIGDKMSGRHGNKGIVSKILKEEDMPYLADGTPVDIVLTPLGVPSRMNLGQIYETLLGWAGYVLGEKYATPIFDGISLDEINRKLEEAGLPYCGEVQLYDGLTGEKFDQKSTVGFIYMLKLNHLVEDKVHARSIGQYTMITQQPLGGRVLFGGQRLGEMEVWALEAFGAAHILQEMLTVKSDDIVGRSQTYEAIIKGGPFPKPGVPEAFKVLISELRGLALSITFN